MINVMRAVLDAKVPGLPSVKYVLLVLANFADIEGRNVYPSIATVQAVSGLGKATVRRAIRQLESSRLLVLVNEARQHSAREYRIDLEALGKLPRAYRSARAIRANALNAPEGNHRDRQGNHGERQGDQREPQSGSETLRTVRDTSPLPGRRKLVLGSGRRDDNGLVKPLTDRGRRAVDVARVWLDGNRPSSESLTR